MPSRQQIKYFDRFGKVNYDFSNENALAVMTNITKFIRAEDRGELSSYLYYDIQPGDRPAVQHHQSGDAPHPAGHATRLRH